MIDRGLKKIIEDGTNSGCKIVYVGDHCQMAPVGEKLSVVWQDPSIQRVNLTIPVRNSGQPALMALCDQLRQTVETGIFKPIALVPGVIMQLSDQEMEHHVARVFHDIEHDSRLLTYTNDMAHSYNNHIRGLRGHYDRFNTGEVVVNNSGMELSKKAGTLVAEMEFHVKRDVTVPDETLTIEGMDIHYYPIQLTSLKDNFIYVVYQPDDPDFLKRVMKYFKGNKDWGNFFRLKNMFPDLRSRDASTIYKAQGSTFKSVYIDLQNVGTSNIANQVARMLYVAVSRAENRVYFYGRLPDKYIGA